jgi:hypothetical protein
MLNLAQVFVKISLPEGTKNYTFGTGLYCSVIPEKNSIKNGWINWNEQIDPAILLSINWILLRFVKIQLVVIHGLSDKFKWVF